MSATAPIEWYNPPMLHSSCTSVGGRPNQEDSLLVFPERRVFAVADGMGGHEHGEVASRVAVEALRDVFGKSDLDRTGLVKRTLELATIEANERVTGIPFQQYRPGTTLTAIAFEPGWGPSAFRAYVAHSGDSRCYLLRDGKLHQLTRDHTISGHSLYKCLGYPAADVADVVGFSWHPGDTLMLCSDGLHGVVPDPLIAHLMAQPEPARALVQEALNSHTSDNVTVVTVRV